MKFIQKEPKGKKQTQPIPHFWDQNSVCKSTKYPTTVENKSMKPNTKTYQVKKQIH